MFKEICIEFIIAGVSSFGLTAILSHYIIPILVAKKAGQPIRREGPKSHFSKQGTPTMGGIAFIMAIAIVLTGLTVWYAISKKQSELIPMALTMALAVMNGMIGFVDDYRKLIKKDNEGLKAGQKFSLQVIAAIVYVVLLKLLGHIDTAVHIPFTNINVELGIVYYIFARNAHVRRTTFYVYSNVRRLNPKISDALFFIFKNELAIVLFYRRTLKARLFKYVIHFFAKSSFWQCDVKHCFQLSQAPFR